MPNAEQADACSKPRDGDIFDQHAAGFDGEDAGAFVGVGDEPIDELAGRRRADLERLDPGVREQEPPGLLIFRNAVETVSGVRA